MCNHNLDFEGGESKNSEKAANYFASINDTGCIDSSSRSGVRCCYCCDVEFTVVAGEALEANAPVDSDAFVLEAKTALCTKRRVIC